MTRFPLLLNPYTQYTTAIDLPGLKAGAGEEYHYPWIAPEGHVQHRKEIAVASVAGKLAPGWSILPGWKVGTEGKGQGMRQQVFKLLYDGKLTDKYAVSPEGAAELSHKIDPSTMKRWVPEWRKAKANPAYFITGEEEDEGEVVRTPRQPRKKGGQAGGSVRLTPVQMQKVAELMREGLSRAEAVAFVLQARENPRSVLSRARALNAQYDRDSYTGSSRAQLAQARQLSEDYNSRTSTSSPEQLDYARLLGAAYDQDSYEGSSAAQLAHARALEAAFDAQDNPRVFKKGKGKFKEIPQSVNARQRWLDEAAYISSRGLGGYEREAGLGEYPQAVRFTQTAQDNPRLFQKGKAKYKQTPQSVEQQWEHFMKVGEMWHEAGPEDYHAGSTAFAARFPAPAKKYGQVKDNPFWVTPQGSAVHHSDEAWAGYQSRHGAARLPAQAEREALLEKQGDFAPGWSGHPGTRVASNGKTYAVIELYLRGKDTGKFATDRRKAVEMSHAYSPETGKWRKR